MENSKLLITDLLLSKKDFSLSTLKTYASLLYGIYKQFENTPPEQAFNDIDKVTTIVETPGRPASSRATIYSALYGATGNIAYHERMKELSAVVTEEYKKQKNSIKRNAVSLTMDDIRQIYRDLFLKASQKDRTQNDIVNVLIAGLMSGVIASLPPRRLLDYTEMHFVTGSDSDADDNIIFSRGDKYEMYFNKYKTAAIDRQKGVSAVFHVPKQLVGFVNMRLMAPSTTSKHFLLVNSQGAKFSPASLHARLLSIYGFGVDMIRSIYISELHKGTPSIKSMEHVAKSMGHSVGAQMLFYVKK